jgi:sialate O-acetylesterase
MNTNFKLSVGRRIFFIVGMVAILWLPVSAAVRLPQVFSDHMVLQRGQPVNVWGWAAPGEVVSVELNGRVEKTTALPGGEWKVALPAMPAGGPFQLVVRASNQVVFQDVMIGEVWLCSGQSNMEMGIAKCDGAETAIAAATLPELRLLMVPNRWTPLAQTNIDATWKVCTPASVKEGGWGGFSACAFYFGRKLHEDLQVPIGLIDATWGGTRIESWTPPEGFAAVPALRDEYEKVLLADPTTPTHQQRLEEFLHTSERWIAEARQALRQRVVGPTMPTYPPELLPPHDLQQATALFNGMIHPLCPFTLAGAIWYQGESNLNDGAKYTDRMRALIRGWRQRWGQGDFPFNFVQIAPYLYNNHPEAEAELWEAQAAATSEPQTGMVVINDIGNLHDIHPTDKKTVGERLARIALAQTYGQTQLEFSGPTFRALQVENGRLRVLFDHADGLTSRDGKPLTWFEVIDADRGGFVPADAKIEGKSVVLSAAAAPRPVAMRFAWDMRAEPNLVNAAGLPAGAFRAGQVPERDTLEMHVPEARDYELVYDLDLNQLGRQLRYAVDRSATIRKPFDRIAYFLELQPKQGRAEFVYVSVKAFTSDLKKIGVPTAASGARFQQNVEEMNVFSDVKRVVTGTGLTGGNIEFWSSNYAPDNAAQVPGASSQAYDFGDAPADGAEGYGSMQIHNHQERQTIFALNHWSEGPNADVGIGNQGSGHPDWTFARNAGNYSAKRLRVLVRLTEN